MEPSSKILEKRKILVIGGIQTSYQLNYVNDTIYTVGNYKYSYYGKDLDIKTIKFWEELYQKLTTDNLKFDCFIITAQEITIFYELNVSIKNEIYKKIISILDNFLSPNGVIILKLINDIKQFKKINNKYIAKNIEDNVMDFYELKRMIFQKFEKLKYFIIDGKNFGSVYCILSNQKNINNTVLKNRVGRLYRIKKIKNLKNNNLEISDEESNKPNYIINKMNNKDLAIVIEETNQIDFCIRRIINNHNNH